MKIAFFSESNFDGKILRDYENMRTEYAWYVGLDAIHHHVGNLPSMESEMYDLGIVIIPKNKEMLFNYPLVDELKRICKKIATMQESTYWYWQGGSVESQLWYHNILQSMDNSINILSF